MLSRWRYAVFLHEISIGRPKEDEKLDIFRYISRFPPILSKNNQKKKKEKRRKPQLNARKHWESESRNRNLSASVLHVKPSRHNSNLYDSRENLHQEEILNYSVSQQYRKRNRDFITIDLQFQGVFYVLESYIGFESWD